MADKPCFDPAETLFLTDLDGTLLDPGAVLPNGAREKIRSLYERGVFLTYATARTIRSAAVILDGVPFSAPVSLMNGTFLRDMRRGVYLKKHVIDHAAAERLLSLPAEPFIYTLDGADELFTVYRKIANPIMASFMHERIEKYHKPFRCIGDGAVPGRLDGLVVYFCYLGTHEALFPVYAAQQNDPAVQCTFYPDHIYADTWYLEVFAADASKGNAVRELREATGVRKIVAFGDNFNDIPMLREADYAVAVESAADTVLAAADEIVRPGMGILDWIDEHTK